MPDNQTTDEIEEMIQRALWSCPQADEAFGVREPDGGIKVTLYRSGQYHQTMTYYDIEEPNDAR